MENGNRHGVLDTKTIPAMPALVCQQERKSTVGCHAPSLQTWKLINNKLGKVIKEVTINSSKNLNKPPETPVRNY